MECFEGRRKEEGGRKNDFGNHVFDIAMHSYFSYSTCPMREAKRPLATVFHDAAAPSAPPPWMVRQRLRLLRLDACTGLSETQALYSYYCAAAEAADHVPAACCT